MVLWHGARIRESCVTTSCYIRHGEDQGASWGPVAQAPKQGHGCSVTVQTAKATRWQLRPQQPLLPWPEGKEEKSERACEQPPSLHLCMHRTRTAAHRTTATNCWCLLARLIYQEQSAPAQVHFVHAYDQTLP